MTAAPGGTTCDGFLDGRLQILQPTDGYRAATDPVFLAASVPAKTGQSVLELGCGAGVASLCLGWRVRGLQLVGVEVQPDYAELAELNALRNEIPLSVIRADITNLPPSVTGTSFDNVILNPPFFGRQTVTVPGNAGKQVAHVERTLLQDWLHIALKRLKPRGHVSLIHLSERLPEIMASLYAKTGDICILPLAPRPGKAARRVIVTARKGTAGPATLLAPFVVHASASHKATGGDFSPRASAVLRSGQALDLA